MFSSWLLCRADRPRNARAPVSRWTWQKNVQKFIIFISTPLNGRTGSSYFLVKFGELLPTIFVSTRRSCSQDAHSQNFVSILWAWNSCVTRLFFAPPLATKQNGFITDNEIKLLHHGIRWIGFSTVMAPKYHRTHHQPNYPHPLHTQSMSQPTDTASDQDDPPANLVKIRIN